jgi:integrase
MCLFKVNTGTRAQEVCQLRWDWEYDVPELELSLFIVPEGYVKNGEARLIIPNQIARSVIEEQRRQWFGQSDFVFPNLHTKRPFTKIRNNGWRTAWDKAALPTGHNICHGVHVLKHTCGRRLRAAGVSRETRKIYLGHTDGDITTHYSAAEI